MPEEEWTLILPRQKLGPHRQHYFQLQNVDGNVFTHVRLTIYPDGGIKRVRIMGKLHGYPQEKSPKLAPNKVITRIMSPLATKVAGMLQVSEITAFPLTPMAFAAFGQVLMAWKPTDAPKDLKVTSANQGTAHKFHLLSRVESSYPDDKIAPTGFSIYRSSPAGAKLGGVWEVKLLERHPYTNQAFIPMGSYGTRDDESPTGKAYLIIVTLNGADDKPDLDSLKAFVATNSQGIVYNTGIWRRCQHQSGIPY